VNARNDEREIEDFFTIDMHEPQECAQCEGYGLIASNTDFDVCPECHGEGIVEGDGLQWSCPECTKEQEVWQYP
jgi:DnaJ-class molecular chaperone